MESSPFTPDYTFKGFALKQSPPSPLSPLKPRSTLVRDTSDPSVWTQLKRSVRRFPGDGTTAQARSRGMKPWQAAWHNSAMIGIDGILLQECTVKSGLDMLATK